VFGTPVSRGTVHHTLHVTTNPDRLEIHPLTEDRVGAAAALLADRHARHRAAESLLPDVRDFHAQVARELGRERASGVIASRGGVAVAYLVGRVEADGGLGDTRAVVDLAGCAARAYEAEVVRDLYAALAGRWLAEGCRRHLALVPATDDALVDAWFRLAFGLQFTTAVRETVVEPPAPAEVTIPRGSPPDLPATAAFDRLLWTLQAEAPSFSGLDVEAEDFTAEWRDTWDDPHAFPHFVADREGRVVGHALLYRRPTGDLRVPNDNIDLAHAATLEHVRGAGIGVALTDQVLHWAQRQGFRSMTTDWRSVNLLSSRFWPRRGFRPTFFRLYRSLP